MEQEFYCLGRLGSQGRKEKKSGFEEFYETFEGSFFQLFRAKKFEKKNLASALKSYIKWLLYIYIFFF